MKIEIISVSAMSEGAEMLLSLVISNDEGKRERKKILLFTEQYLELGLRRGSIIDEDTFEKLEEMSKLCLAMRKGSDLLSYSASSQVRLAQRLRSKGIDKKSAVAAAERLGEMGLINEEHDVERLVSSCVKKLWGKKKIYRELCAKGYEKEIVSRELSTIGDDVWVENCVALFRKKHKTFTNDPAVQKKIIASLARNGYSFSEIKRAIEIIEE